MGTTYEIGNRLGGLKKDAQQIFAGESHQYLSVYRCVGRTAQWRRRKTGAARGGSGEQTGGERLGCLENPG